ncbi:MAG: HlyD family efflux transporter periplasmic adaptor subunit [Gammaproteobacteria bacterium]|nr:HlyD family efflux transporter periplasmic adaptor subunit [Gammaproteobacteria bacterium]
MARFRGSAWQPVLFSKPAFGHLLTFVGVGAGTAVAIFAATFDFARKVQVFGYLTPADGWARVVAQSPGVVRDQLVSSGDFVQFGDILLEISSGQGLKASLTVQERMLEEIEGRRKTLEKQSRLVDDEYTSSHNLLEQQSESLRRELDGLEQEIRFARNRVKIAQRRYRDGRRLVSEGALPQAELTQLDEERQVRLLALSERRRDVERLRHALAEAGQRQQRFTIERDLKQAAIQGELHDLAMNESRLRNQAATQVLAPRSGVVASVRVRTGDAVQLGQSLLDIVPRDGALQARLFAPPAATAFVKHGQEVRVFLDAFPYERHGSQRGQVVAVSKTAIVPDENMVSQGRGSPAYRVDVAFPDGFSLPPAQIPALRPGMTLTADLVRDYNTLIDWALEPFRASAQRL